MQVHVLIVEYPGYGIYPGTANEKQILRDSLIAYDFLTNEIHFQKSKIFVWGRSLGCGPAIFLARYRTPCMMFLVSPFTSIKSAAKKYVGFLSYFVGDYFKNICHISWNKCPVLFIHGKRDKIVPYSETNKLS